MAKKERNEVIIPEEIIVNKIYLVRGIKVMLDSDLAELYGVETKQLKRQVRRNIARFPEVFHSSIFRVFYQCPGIKLFLSGVYAFWDA